MNFPQVCKYLEYTKIKVNSSAAIGKMNEIEISFFALSWRDHDYLFSFLRSTMEFTIRSGAICSNATWIWIVFSLEKHKQMDNSAVSCTLFVSHEKRHSCCLVIHFHPAHETCNRKRFLAFDSAFVRRAFEEIAICNQLTLFSNGSWKYCFDRYISKHSIIAAHALICGKYAFILNNFVVCFFFNWSYNYSDYYTLYTAKNIVRFGSCGLFARINCEM